MYPVKATNKTWNLNSVSSQTFLHMTIGDLGSVLTLLHILLSCGIALLSCT
jgi:hypothetical protein